MKTYLDCIPCFFKQVLQTGRIAGMNENDIRILLNKLGHDLHCIGPEQTPADIGDFIYSEIRKMSGINDPYAKHKKKAIREVKALMPMVSQWIEKADDKLLAAVRIAIAGNVIDMGAGQAFDIEKDLQTIMQQEFAIFDYEEFREAAIKANTILYLGDNAGETVFDTLLIRQLDRKVIYAVREVPVLNDATMEDAIESGLGDVSTLISSGNSAPATILSKSSEEFLEIFHSADMVISKGQGNYEGLSAAPRDIFFLLKAKCKVISRDLEVSLHDIILKHHKGEN